MVFNTGAALLDAIVLSVVCPDGHDGMPGNRKIVMTYSLTSENEFKVEYVAETDKATHMNISHHSFFNLKGEGNGTINDHVLYINASRTTPVDALLIPTGEIADVTGTPFDFREPKTIGRDLGAENEQLQHGAGYDHNWVLDRVGATGLELAASVYEPASGRCMEVWTDQPALQFYGGKAHHKGGRWHRRIFQYYITRKNTPTAKVLTGRRFVCFDAYNQIGNRRCNDSIVHKGCTVIHGDIVFA